MAMECIKEAIKVARALVKEKECEEMIKELEKLEKLDREKEKVRVKKMKGFLL